MNKIELHKQICGNMHNTYKAKNADYGDSFAKVRREYPEAICVLRGVPPDEGFRLLNNPARRNIKWNEEMFEEIELMRQNGMKWADIGGMYQVDGTTVCKSYHRFKGKKKREYQRHDEEFYNEIHRLRQQGVKWDDIAERMGLSTSRLCSLYGYWKKRNAE